MFVQNSTKIIEKDKHLYDISYFILETVKQKSSKINEFHLFYQETIVTLLNFLSFSQARGAFVRVYFFF